jgi:hypothetical protein
MIAEATACPQCMSGMCDWRNIDAGSMVTGCGAMDGVAKLSTSQELHKMEMQLACSCALHILTMSCSMARRVPSSKSVSFTSGNISHART